MYAEAWNHFCEPQGTGIALHNVVIHRCQVQGLGQGPGAIVLHRLEQRPVELAGMPGGRQVSGNQPLRQDVQRQIAHLIPFPFHAQMCDPFPLMGVTDLEGTQFFTA